MNYLKKCGILILCQALAAPVMADGLSGAYLAGRQARYASDFQSAAQYFTRALAQDPGNPALLESAALAFVSLGEIASAAPIARKMQEGGLDSQVANMVLTAADAQSGDYQALLDRIKAGKAVGPLVDGLLAAWAHVGLGAMSEALEAFDAVAKEVGLGGFAAYHRALALASVGDFEGAEAIFSDDATGPVQMSRRGGIARVEILSQLERNDDAVVLLDDLFGADLDPGLREMRRALVAGETLDFSEITEPRDGMAEVFYSVAGALTSEAGPEITLLYTRIAEYLRPDLVDAILMSAQLLEILDRHELAIATYKKVPRDHPAFHAAELGRVEALRRSDRSDTAIEVLEQLAKSHADIPIVHVTTGDLMRQLERYDEAVAAYDRALSLYPEETPSQWFVHYARGICHERLGHWQEAEADFRAALRLNPDHPQVLNYLGYSMVEKGIKLDEALAMIEKAVSLEPDSGYIVDSLGWVLYRLGRYSESVGHMERAAELMPVDPIVNDHLGDVLWSVGRKLEAQFQWNRAMSFDPDEADEKRIRRKLEVGLDVVLEEEGSPPLQTTNESN